MNKNCLIALDITEQELKKSAGDRFNVYVKIRPNLAGAVYVSDGIIDTVKRTFTAENVTEQIFLTCAELAGQYNIDPDVVREKYIQAKESRENELAP